MRAIPIKIHGVLDYSWSVLIIVTGSVLPSALHPASLILMITGITTILYSLCTSYELGPIKLIPFKAHIALDATIGLFLIASPWLFSFNDQVLIPHLAFGIVEIIVVILTARQPTTIVR